MDELQEYNDLVRDHFLNPRNAGLLEDASGIGVETNPVCGDSMRLMVKVEGDQIVEARFQTVGCPAAIATSSIATEMIKGRPIAEVERLTREDFASALGGLPRNKLHCSVLAADALRAALEDYRARRVMS